MPTVTAPNSLKVVAVLDPRELLDLVVPDGRQRLGLTIRLPDRTVTADLNAKSVRRAIISARSLATTSWPSCASERAARDQRDPRVWT